MKNLLSLNHYFVKYKWHLIFGILFVSLSNFFRVKIPQTIRKALDDILEKLSSYKSEENSIISSEQIGEISSNLLQYALYIVGFALVMGIFMYFMRMTIVVMSRLIEYDIRKHIYSHYQIMDSSFYKKHKTGDLMSRFSEDIVKVRMYLGPALLYAINLASLAIIVIYSMFQVNVKLSLYTLLPLPILSISIYIISQIVYKRSMKIQVQLAKLNSIAQEVYSGIRVIKSYVKTRQFGNYFSSASENYKDKSMDLAKVNAFFFPLMILLVSSSTLITVLICGIEVHNGNASPGNIAEFVIYINMLTWPVTAIGWIASIVQQAEASQTRIMEFLDEKTKITNPVINPVPIEGEIEFRNVNFSYPNSGVQALKSVSFSIKKGEKLAILGRTASGKSSLAKLVLRVYDVDSGNILIDGSDIRTMDLNNLRKRVAYVPQDVFLFSDTVGNNIAFGMPESNKTDIKKYATYACINTEIEKLPENYDTLVGERGVTLSGGQKQRIALARALIKNPDILLLDDSLSAVDTDTEQKILHYFNSYFQNRTVVIITHRIYNMLDFDKIIFLEDGKIMEEGKHEELLLKKGYYYDLYMQQIEKKDRS